MQAIQHAGNRKTRLMLGTTNRGKIAELLALLAARLPPAGSYDGQLEALVPGGDLPEVEETGATVAENAAIKASAYAGACGEWTLADDTALAVDALGGAPGIHTARYAGPHAQPADNRRRLLTELADVPLERRGADFTCHLALADPTGRIRATSEGRCHGRICTAPAGDEGFGYDPLFEIIEFRRTFAELGLATRGVLSHRARAMEKMIPHIAELLALDPPTLNPPARAEG
jgi:XTP/dITP diphosphohydrolase